MRSCIFAVCMFFTAMSAAALNLQEIANFHDQQVTGVAVSKSGRVFVNFPNWSDDHTISVAELIDGKSKPYPNETWNEPGPASTHFICVQSVYVDAEDNLWILDPAAPKMQGIVKDGPKLVKVDLKTNKSVRIIPFEEDVASKKSYLNDVDGAPPNSLNLSIPQDGLEFQLAPTAVPEPSTFALAAFGLGGLLAAVKRRRLAS